MTTDTQTLAAFVAEHGITLQVLDGPTRARDDGGWEHDSYTLRLVMDGQTLDSPWRQGTGITDEPTPEALLDAMASDSAGVENAQSFEDWCGEYGEDTDSRRAERTYNQCVEQAKALGEFLGRESFDRLLYSTDRL